MSGTLDITFVDDRLFDPGDEVLPERHVERMVLERKEIARGRSAMDVRHATDRRSGKVHGHGHAIA